MLFLVLSKSGYYCGMSMNAAELHKKRLKSTGPIIKCCNVVDVIRCIKMSGKFQLGRLCGGPRRLL